MIILEHPIWKYIRPYVHLGESDRANVDVLDLPDSLRNVALDVRVNCCACGAVISPFRRRVQSERARIVGAPEERRLFYSGTCPSEKNAGCSRTNLAGEHKDLIVKILRFTAVGCTVINIKDAPVDWQTNPRYVYIGRSGNGLFSTLGNPHPLHRTCPLCKVVHLRGEAIAVHRAEAIARYEVDSAYRQEVELLRGNFAVCFCSPLPCHGQVYDELLRGAISWR